MKSHYWIKLYHEILDDPKMGPLPCNVWRRAIECFLLAGEEQDAGFLPPLQAMSWRLRIDQQTLERELQMLAAAGILQLADYNPFERRWLVTNFEKRQSPSPVAQRVREHRQRKERKEPKERKEEKKQIQITDTDTYCNVTSLQNVTGNVTFRYIGAPGDDDEAVGRVWRLMEDWQSLTGYRFREDDKQAQFRAANDLLLRAGWDDKQALELLRQERQAMLDAGKRPGRITALTPGIFAVLDGAQPGSTTSANSDQPRNMKAIDYLTRVINGEA